MNDPADEQAREAAVILRRRKFHGHELADEVVPSTEWPQVAGLRRLQPVEHVQHHVHVLRRGWHVLDDVGLVAAELGVPEDALQDLQRVSEQRADLRACPRLDTTSFGRPAYARPPGVGRPGGCSARAGICRCYRSHAPGIPAPGRPLFPDLWRVTWHIGAAAGSRGAEEDRGGATWTDAHCDVAARPAAHARLDRL